MRTDEHLARPSFRFSPEWKGRGAGLDPQIDARLAGVEKRGETLVVHSLSGNERNHYFENREGRAFDDLSALAGLDSPADSRGFALLDYDRDGWQDIAMVNANQPLFNLYHNEMPAAGRTGGVVAVRFVGGNRGAAPSTEFACRDGFGARVRADLGDVRLLREHRCGDGFSAQHSATMLLGLGSRPGVKRLTVQWPSGRTAEIADVPEGTLLTVYENPADSPSREAFVRNTYRSDRPMRPRPAADRATFPLATADTGMRGPVRVFTTLATWCPSCKKHLPVLRQLDQELRDEGLDLVAVPIDENDDQQKLADYAREWHLPSRLAALPPADRPQAVAAFHAALGESPPLPATVVTDADGRILAAQPGVPSVSTLRQIINATSSKGVQRTAADQ